MALKLTKEEDLARRTLILESARWCFLSFGYAKTSLEDIAKRANISRTLLYRTFRDKEHIFKEVFIHWLVSRHSAALKLANSQGDRIQRLLEVCQLMVVDPWSEMVETPMGKEFLEACDQIDPATSLKHRKVVLRCATTILGDEALAEIFILALDGMLTDEPTPKALLQRLRLLVPVFLKSGKVNRAPQEA